MIIPERQKSMAVIQDFSGHGRCSLSVALPIISAMGVECSCLPTAFFSNHTAYEHYFFEDFTPNIPSYVDAWKKLALKFDGIYTGFLGSAEQISIVSDFIAYFGKDGATVIVDPVMGDDGKLYATYTEEMCEKMRLLVSKADIITPNVTEACILTDTPYRKGGFSDGEISDIAKRLIGLGAKKVVITGVERNNKIDNYVADKGGASFVGLERSGSSRCGTGDVFASIVAAATVRGEPLDRAVARAAEFVRDSIALADRMDIEENGGVPFELLLGNLCGE